MKTQKGITLIALIITIIVMLILVGVSVSAALNGGLFKAAQGAAKNTQLARNEELAISDGTIIDDYLDIAKGNKYRLILKDADGNVVAKIPFKEWETWDDLKNDGRLGDNYEVEVDGTTYYIRLVWESGAYYTTDWFTERQHTIKSGLDTRPWGGGYSKLICTTVINDYDGDPEDMSQEIEENSADLEYESI